MNLRLFLFLLPLLLLLCNCQTKERTNNSNIDAKEVTNNSNIDAKEVTNNYYIDATEGSDANDGLSENGAWKSLHKLKDIELKPGDSLLLRRGTTFNELLEISAQGTAERPIVVGAYGVGEKPCISAPDGSMYAVLVKNSDYVTVQHLEVVNTGSTRLAGRTGVKVLCENYGVSHNITLSALYVHDVNGSLVKQEGGGSGILIENGGKEIVSTFDSMLIENCVIRRCERNAMIWGGYWSRQEWHPSTNLIVRKNLIEEVPGDGIVPIGCDGALIEYNLMRNCPRTLPQTEAAAGMWSWSCDNTILQFNEVSDHKAPWDGQGFDSDYNCNNTTIQYNYSHDNEGGFVLICNSGNTPKEISVGNVGTVVQYNVSFDDAIRTLPTRQGMFSPTVHISGPCEDTRVSNNLLHTDPKPAANVDRSIITMDSWDGYANNTIFKENLFFAADTSEIRLYESTNTTFEGNYYLGQYRDKPEDKSAKTRFDYYDLLMKKTPSNPERLPSMFDTITVGDGAATMKAVNKNRVTAFFDNIR